MSQKSKRQPKSTGTAPLCPDCKQPAKPRARGYHDWKPGQFVFTCVCEFRKL